MDWDEDREPFSDTNYLGNVVSCARLNASKTSPFFQWSDYLLEVNREAREVYTTFYRLCLTNCSWAKPAGDSPSDHPIQRLNPDTDIVEVQVWEDMDYSNPDYDGLVPCFLYDSWAYDPKGEGLKNIVVGRPEYEKGLRGHEFLLDSWFEKNFGSMPKEAQRGFHQYFSRFGNISTHSFRVAIPISLPMARYGVPRVSGVYIRDSETIGDTMLRRAVPFMFPNYNANLDAFSSSAEVGATFDCDPRPIFPMDHDQNASNLIQESGDYRGNFENGEIRHIPVFPILSDPNLLDPLQIVSNWLGVLSRFDVRREKAIQGVQYLVAVWPGWDGFTEDLAGPFTTKGYANWLYGRDQARLAFLHKKGRSDKAQELEQLLLASDSGVLEVAGAWLFQADAFGPVAEDPSVYDDRPPGTSDMTVDLAVHKPELMVLRMLE